MATGAKQKGTATYMRYLSNTVGTVDIFTESRTFDVDEKSNRTEVTTRGDTAKKYIAELPEITIKVGGMDYIAGTTSPTPAWDTAPIGDSGTVEWAPEGTAAGARKRTLGVILQSKSWKSPYEGVATWDIEFASNGGTVTHSTW